MRTGALEGSGADPARAMTDMIASLRAFESGQKVITTIDSTLQKASNQVGSTSRQPALRRPSRPAGRGLKFRGERTIYETRIV